MKPLTLWADVPLEKRVTREFLETRKGGGAPDGEEWIQRKLRHIENPQCKAAVRWATGEDVWTPCAFRPHKGNEFCLFHGGGREGGLTAREKQINKLTRRAETLAKTWEVQRRKLVDTERSAGMVEQQLRKLRSDAYKYADDILNERVQ